MKKSKLKGRLRTLASLFQGKTTFNIRSPTHLAFQQRPRESNILGADCIKESVFCNYFLKSQAEDARNACRSAQRHPPEAGRRKAGDGQQSSSQTPSTSLGGCSDMGRRQGTKLAAPCGHGSHRDLPHRTQRGRPGGGRNPPSPLSQPHLVRAQLLHRLPLNGDRTEGAFLRPAAGQLRGSALPPPPPPQPPGPPHKGIAGAASPRSSPRPPQTRCYRSPRPPLPLLGCCCRLRRRPRGSRNRRPPPAPLSPGPRPRRRRCCPAQGLFIKTTGRRPPSCGGIT